MYTGQVEVEAGLLEELMETALDLGIQGLQGQGDSTMGEPLQPEEGHQAEGPPKGPLNTDEHEDTKIDETLLQNMFGDLNTKHSTNTFVSESGDQAKKVDQMVIRDDMFESLRKEKVNDKGSVVTTNQKTKHKKLVMPKEDIRIKRIEFRNEKMVSKGADKINVLDLQSFDENEKQKHSDGKSAKCTECPKQFVKLVRSENGSGVTGTKFTQTEVEEHMKSHRNLNVSVTKNEMNATININKNASASKTMSSTCKICQKSFDYGSLKKHMEKDHTIAEPNNVVVNEFSCRFCSRTFQAASNLNTHMKNLHFEDWAKWKVSLMTTNQGKI